MAFRYFYGSAFVLTSDADVSFHHLSDFEVGALLPWPSHVHAVISRSRHCMPSCPPPARLLGLASLLY